MSKVSQEYCWWIKGLVLLPHDVVHIKGNEVVNDELRDVE